MLKAFEFLFLKLYIFYIHIDFYFTFLEGVGLFVITNILYIDLIGLFFNYQLFWLLLFIYSFVLLFTIIFSFNLEIYLFALYLTNYLLEIDCIFMFIWRNRFTGCAFFCLVIKWSSKTQLLKSFWKTPKENSFYAFLPQNRGHS